MGATSLFCSKEVKHDCRHAAINNVMHHTRQAYLYLCACRVHKSGWGSLSCSPTYPRARGKQRNVFTGAASSRRMKTNAFILYVETSRGLRVASGWTGVVESCFGLLELRGFSRHCDAERVQFHCKVKKKSYRCMQLVFSQVLVLCM